MPKVDGNTVAQTLRENIANNFNLLTKMDAEHALDVANQVVSQLNNYLGSQEDESSES